MRRPFLIATLAGLVTITSIATCAAGGLDIDCNIVAKSSDGTAKLSNGSDRYMLVGNDVISFMPDITTGLQGGLSYEEVAKLPLKIDTTAPWGTIENSDERLIANRVSNYQGVVGVETIVFNKSTREIVRVHDVFLDRLATVRTDVGIGMCKPR